MIPGVRLTEMSDEMKFALASCAIFAAVVAVGLAFLDRMIS